MSISFWNTDDPQHTSHRPPEDDVWVQSQNADSHGNHTGGKVEDAAPRPSEHDGCYRNLSPLSPQGHHLDVVEEVPLVDSNYNVPSVGDLEKSSQENLSAMELEAEMATEAIPVSSSFNSDSINSKSAVHTAPALREDNKETVTAVSPAGQEVDDHRINDCHDADDKEERLKLIGPIAVAKYPVRRKSLYIYIGNSTINHEAEDVSSLSEDDEPSRGTLKGQEEEILQPISHFLTSPNALGQQPDGLLEAQYDWTQNSSEPQLSREDLFLSRREDDDYSFGGTEQEQYKPAVSEVLIQMKTTPRPVEVDIQLLGIHPSPGTSMEPEYEWDHHASQDQMSHEELDSLESRDGKDFVVSLDNEQDQEATTVSVRVDEAIRFAYQPQDVSLKPEYGWSQLASEEHSSRKEVNSRDTEDRHGFVGNEENESDEQMSISTFVEEASAKTLPLDDYAHVGDSSADDAVEPEYEWSQTSIENHLSREEVGPSESEDGHTSVGGPGREYPESATRTPLPLDIVRQIDPQSSQANDLEAECAVSESSIAHFDVAFGMQQDNVNQSTQVRSSQERDIPQHDNKSTSEPEQQTSVREISVETEQTFTPLHMDTRQEDKPHSTARSVLAKSSSGTGVLPAKLLTPLGSEKEANIQKSGVELYERKNNQSHGRPVHHPSNNVEEERPVSRIESPVQQPQLKAENGNYSPMMPQLSGQLSMLSLSPSPTPTPKPLPVPREAEDSQMHQLLNAQHWTGLLQFMAQLRKESPTTITYELTKTDPAQRATILHRMVERAPLTLTKLLVSMIPFGSRHEILLLQDFRGNTALHLACANLYIDTKTKTIDDAVIKAIGIGAPVAHETKNQDGQIPIALLLTSKAMKATADRDLVAVESSAEDLVQRILVGQPDLVSLRNKQDQTLLHIGLANGVHQRVLLHLFQQAEFTAGISDAHGRLPLHYIASGISSPYPSINLAEQLLLAAPEALTTPCSSGDTPLHLFVINISTAISEEGDSVTAGTVQLTELLLGKFPVESMCPLLVQNKLGMTPLHCCARYAAPAAVVHVLMRSVFAKRALNMVDAHKSTPLHIICDSPAIGSMVEHIRSMGTEESSARIDAKGRTPLHIAAENPMCTTESIEAVINVNPKAAKMENLSGRLPLHLALRKNTNEDILRKLILANPKAVKSVFHGDNGICHELCEFKAPSSIMEFLLQVYPEGARRANKLLNLPLHVAVLYMCDMGTVRALVKAYPEACTTYNKRKDIPLHYASKYKTTKEIMAFLINAAPGSVNMPDANGVTPMDNCTENGTLHIAKEALRKSKAKSQKSKNHKNRDSSPSRSSRQVVEAKFKAGGKEARQSDDAAAKDRRSPNRSGHGNKRSSSHEKDRINRRGRSDVVSPSQAELDKLTNILNRSLESASLDGDFDSDASPSLVVVHKPRSVKVIAKAGTEVKRRRSRSLEASKQRERSTSVSRSGHAKDPKNKGAGRSGKKVYSKADDERRRSKSLGAPKQREKITKDSKSKDGKKYRQNSKGRTKSTDTAKNGSAREMKKVLKGLQRSLLELSSDQDSWRETGGGSNVSKKGRKSRSMKDLTSSTRSLEDLRRDRGSDHRSGRKSRKLERRRSKSMSPLRQKSVKVSEHRRTKTSARPPKRSSDRKSPERDSNHTSSKRTTSESKSSKHSSDHRSSKRASKVESPKRDKSSSSKAHYNSRGQSAPVSPRGWSSPLHSSSSSGRPPIPSPKSSISVSKSSSSRIQKGKEKASLVGVGQSLRGSSYTKEERMRTTRSTSPRRRRHLGSDEQEEWQEPHEETELNSRTKNKKKKKKEKKKKSTKEKWAENLSILRRQSLNKTPQGGESRSTSSRGRRGVEATEPLLDPRIQQMVDPRLDSSDVNGGSIRGDARMLVALPFLLPTSIEMEDSVSNHKERSLTQSKRHRSRSRR